MKGSHPIHGSSVRDEWVSWRAESGEEEGFDSLAMAMLMDNFRPVAYNFPGIEISKNWIATLSR